MPEIYSIDEAPVFIIIHLSAAMIAVILGAGILFRKKGTVPHRWLGRTWAGLMYFVAIGSFWIQARDRLSLIHILSVIVIVNLSFAIWFIREKKVLRHKVCMICAYAALCITGAFTLLPYRMLGQYFFG